MHTILFAELSDDVRRTTTDEKARALRARFHRLFAAWSSKRRVVQTLLVVDEDGNFYQTLEVQVSALSQYLGRQFSETCPIDHRAAEEKLQHIVVLQPESLRMLDFDTCSGLFDHLPHSAPGPDGLPYACWSTAGDRARRTLFSVYSAVAVGTSVPPDFDESYNIFILMACAQPGELAYQAPPCRFRPLYSTSRTLHEKHVEGIQLHFGGGCFDSCVAGAEGICQAPQAHRVHH